MFSGLPLVTNEEAYRETARRLEEAQAQLNAAKEANEQAWEKSRYDFLEAQLKLKVEEGEKAQQMLAQLQSGNRAIAAPPAASTSSLPMISYSPQQSARIEELPSPSAAQRYTTHPQQGYHQPSQYQPNNGYHQNANPFMVSSHGAGSSTLQGTFEPSRTSSSFQSESYPAQWLGPSPFYQQAPVMQPYQQQSGNVFQSFPPNAEEWRPSQSTTQPPQRRSHPTTVNPAHLSQSQPPPPQPQPQPQHHVPPSYRPSPDNHAQETRPTTQSQRQASTSAPQRQASTSAPPRQASTPTQQTQAPIRSSARQAAKPQQQTQVPPPPSQPQPTPPPAKQKENEPSAAPTQPPNKAAPTPSYGPSPFAHNPAPAPPAHNPPPAPPAPNPAPAPSARGPAPAPPVVAQDPPLPDTLSDGHKKFYGLINAWQKTTAPTAYMDIPHAHIRVLKLPPSLIQFVLQDNKGGERTLLSFADAFARLNFQGIASIFTNPQGIAVMMQIPLPPSAEGTFKPFAGTALPGAANAMFFEPSLVKAATAAAAAKRPLEADGKAGCTPKDVDKRFLAHDLLRALGKSHLYAKDDEQLRYAKRRALEAPPPVVEEVPVVPLPLRSNESSARTTPVASGSGSGSSSRVASAVAPVPNKIPLFLPPLDDITPSFTPPQRRAPGGRPGSPTPFYVLAPTAPDWVKRDRARLAAEREASKINSVPLGWQEDVDGEEEEALQKALMAESEPEVEPEPDVAVEELRRRRARGMYHNTQNEDEEAAMLETCSRLREVPCKWFACGLVLNSLESLVAHLHEIHAQEDETMTCMWDICGKTCISAGQLAIHAEGHALSSIPCAYQDCEGLFHTPRELVEHNREHTEASENADVNWELLPSFRPSAPVRVKEPEAASPPTWTIVTPPMYMPKISRERHMTLGPWVLRNITAPALNVRAKRYNAAKPMNSWLREDYEFVETSSVHFSSMPSRPARARDIADLDSVEVTGSVSEGKIVLWPPNGAGHLYDARPTTVDSAAKAESVSAGPVAGPPSTLVDGAQAEGVSAGPVAGPSFTLVDKAPSASGDSMTVDGAQTESVSAGPVAGPSSTLVDKAPPASEDPMVVDLSGDSVVVDPSDEMAVEKMLQDGHGQH